MTADTEAARYFVDHGVIHDRITGKHVEIEEAARLLSEGASATERIAWGVVAAIGPQLRAALDTIDTIRKSLESTVEFADRNGGNLVLAGDVARHALKLLSGNTK